MTQTITEELDTLAELQAQVDLMRMHYAALREAVLTDEQRAQLAEIDAEEKTAMEAAQNGVNTLTANVKAAVIAAGATVKGAHLQAVWTKGRVSYDVKALDGYAAGHPEILPFRKEGEPSVTIRGAK